MSNSVELLSRPINFAVVRLPEREFPGVVIQGDTLHSMLQQLNRMADLSSGRDREALNDEINDLKEQLAEALKHYENICLQHSIRLPYVSVNTGQRQ